MQSDPKTLAEVKALLTCINVTQDPTEQNRLWNRYYRLSDGVFPEAAALHKRYKGLQGAERQRFKNEYMELVRRLWLATDPDAAYDVSFTDPPPANAGPLSSPPVPPKVAIPRKSKTPTRSAFHPIGLLAVFCFVAAAGGIYWWTTQAPKAPQTDELVSTELESPDPVQRVHQTLEVPDETVEPGMDDLDDDPPIEEIEAAVTEAIRPEFRSIPPTLQGKGDTVETSSETFHDVYVIESPSQYFLRIPGDGSVTTVAKAEATVRRGEESVRKSLLALWNENQAAIDTAEALREKEKQARLAAHHAVQEKRREVRKKAQEAERWAVKEADWLALTPEQRQVVRSRTLSDWRAINDDVDTVQALYASISQVYQEIGIHDSRARRLQSAYGKWEQSRGPNFSIEDALIDYSLGREEMMRELERWERKYYRLLEIVNERYPECEERVEELQRMDEALPPALKLVETTIDWDRALERDEPASLRPGSGVGTGFVIAEGHVMTCAHVVRGGQEILVRSTAGTTHNATVVEQDVANDWAILRVEGLAGAPIPVAPQPPNIGATIYCLGYPLGGIQGSADPIVGSGNIAALMRLDRDQRYMQITAPVNPGNSGGPVLDQQGRWVGIVSQKMNDQATLDRSQTVAQGMNFAVKASYIYPLISKGNGVNLVPYSGDGTTTMNLEKIAATIASSIVKIEVD